MTTEMWSQSPPMGGWNLVTLTRRAGPTEVPRAVLHDAVADLFDELAAHAHLAFHDAVHVHVVDCFVEVVRGGTRAQVGPNRHVNAVLLADDGLFFHAAVVRPHPHAVHFNPVLSHGFASLPRRPCRHASVGGWPLGRGTPQSQTSTAPRLRPSTQSGTATAPGQSRVPSPPKTP